MERLKSRKLLIWGAGTLAVLLIIGGIAVARSGNDKHETVVVERRDIVEEVRVSGTVEASITSDLGFETGGVVRGVFVKEGDTVVRGELLASLGVGTLAAELQSAQAAVAIKRSKINNTSVNLDAIREKHDALVRNARIELFSDDLIAEPKSSTYTQTAPVIIGRYAGDEGQYKLVIRTGSPSNESDLYVFGMEDTDPVEISKTAPTALGLQGLFVTFPDGSQAYKETTWYVTIPNTKSSSYAGNYGAYQEALNERTRAIEEAQNDLREQSQGSSVAAAELVQAQAEVARIEALISERHLRAPFSGTVTAVDIDPGESASAGSPAISLISDDAFSVGIDLPEIDSIKVHRGDVATIVLDAFGDSMLSGSVASVNRTETLVDGISVYEARIAFDDEDERVASGMTADVTIITNKKEDVLAIPARALRYRTDGTTYVLIVDSATGDDREADVAAGLRGSDGYIEIVAGLSEGDTVAIPNDAT